MLHIGISFVWFCVQGNCSSNGQWRGTCHQEIPFSFFKWEMTESVYMVIVNDLETRENCWCRNRVDTFKSPILKKGWDPKVKSLSFNRCVFSPFAKFLMKLLLDLVQGREKVCSDTSQAPGGDVQLRSIFCHLSTYLWASGQNHFCPSGVGLSWPLGNWKCR